MVLVYLGDYILSVVQLHEVFPQGTFQFYISVICSVIPAQEMYVPNEC